MKTRYRIVYRLYSDGTDTFTPELREWWNPFWQVFPAGEESHHVFYTWAGAKDFLRAHRGIERSLVDTRYHPVP